jgi:hypothetical protein
VGRVFEAHREEKHQITNSNPQTNPKIENPITETQVGTSGLADTWDLDFVVWCFSLGKTEFAGHHAGDAAVAVY